jgi:hypothetical protein
MRLLFVLLIAPLLGACSSNTILRDNDYQISVNAFRAADPKAALDNFPKLEEGGFITTVEKTWLGIWNGSIDGDQLKRVEKQTKTFDDRKFVSVTREAGVFLTQESEEGYVPAEYEVVVLHLTAAMAYMQLGRWEDAEVEARRAGFYLQNPFNRDHVHFDDPALRLWLAGVWAALGDWDAAQVDLKVAKIAMDDKEPKELSVVFSGVAPELKWIEGQLAPEFIGDGKKPAYKYGFDTRSWFLRHAQRNTAIRDVLLKSNYMSQYLSIKATTAAQRGGASSMAIAAGTVGVAVGLAITGGLLYGLAAAGGSGVGGEAIAQIMALGLGISWGSYKGAVAWNKEMQNDLTKEEQSLLTDMRTYRLVRFLPHWISLDVKQVAPIEARSKLVELRAPKSKTTVRFIQAY